MPTASARASSRARPLTRLNVAIQARRYHGGKGSPKPGLNPAGRGSDSMKKSLTPTWDTS